MSVSSVSSALPQYSTASPKAQLDDEPDEESVALKQREAVTGKDAPVATKGRVNLQA